MTLERNPAWKQSSDPLRQAYVDSIDDHRGAELRRASSSRSRPARATWSGTSSRRPRICPRLISANDKRLILGPTGPYAVATGYYLAMNEWTGSMKNKLVRQAVATRVNKNAIVQISGGPKVNAITNQMILPGNVGYVHELQRRTRPTRAAATRRRPRRCSTKAGFPNGVAIKELCSTSDPDPRICQSIQSSLNARGLQGDDRARRRRPTSTAST